ncbi:MAG: CRTAC1 family protein [Acidobacteria bacterium]|nr:MAG: CRTAC1 family protein [Acidobacteriota bacterium]PYU71063.1 MAG: CRTAC1 family protein [Acidobacteriota bacterium]
MSGVPWPGAGLRARSVLACTLSAALLASLKPSEQSRIAFENRQERSGVTFVLNNGTTDDKPIIDSTLGGVALLDYDNDGYLDIFFTNGASIPSLNKSNPAFSNRLYHNNHDGTFTEVTGRAGVTGEGYSMGAAAVDYDNDGWTDLYVTGVNRNILYHNNRDGTFTDVTEKAGVTGIFGGKKLWSVSAAWIDYDNDGLLDLFVTNYLEWSPENSRVCGLLGKRLSCPPSLYKGESNILYHNNGDGTFTDVSAASGIAECIGKGMGVAIADYDGDGWTDIFVANDNERNFLFKNRRGQGFDEVGVESFVAYTDDGVPVSSMGVDFRDWSNSGRPGLFVTALGGETFPLFRNEDRKIFTMATYESGIGFASFKMSGWGAGIYDFDNDGYKDLFSANSHVSENADVNPQQQYRQPNSVFQNLRNATFQDVSAEAGPAVRLRAAHRGAAFGDLDNDGKVDVVISAIGSPAELLYNTSTGGNHWIAIETVGTKSNRDGIGTRIKLTGESGLVQYNEVTTAGSYASSSDKRAHFGLGRDSLVKEIELRWPSGTLQVLRNVKADQILKVTER